MAEIPFAPPANVSLRRSLAILLLDRVIDDARDALGKGDIHSASVALQSATEIARALDAGDG